MSRLLTATLACLLLLPCANVSVARQPPASDALRPAPERYDVTARWARSRLSGTMRLTLRNSGPGPLREIWMRTWPNAFGSCRKPLATLEPSAGTRARCTAQRIALDEPLAPGARTTVTMAFSVRVPRRKDRFGRHGGAAFLGNALPTLAVADEDGWRLPPYFDRGEAWFTLAADWRVQLSLPDGLKVAATGTETSRGVHEASRARDFMLVIGRFRTRTLRAGDITLRHHRLPGRPVSDARRALGAAHAALTAFERWHGPYGRKELDLVQPPVAPGIAMEYPELVLTPPIGGIVAHEVAHQWWAMLMGNDPYREPFLDEGFAEYSANRLPRAVNGPDRLGRCERPRRAPRPPLSAGVPVLGRAYTRTVYFATACMLRRLERALGRNRFDGMLRGLVAEHRDRTWTRADLIAAIEQAAPDGFDVDAFLRREGITRPR